ncbi:MAG: hypothetical protein JNK37_11050 [Verrucomicrobiales bacterium]|nr:hypothetical protein [Verrucomicrobiales bacterium]
MQPLRFGAINPFTGTPFVFGDPNLRFINGMGVYLEPGDPGFTPYPTLSDPKTNQKKRKMKHNSYYPTNVPAQILWLTNFYIKILEHAASLGVSAQAAGIVADCRWLIYLLGTYQPAQKPWSKSNTDFIRDAQRGVGEAAMVLPVWNPPALPAAEPAPGTLPAVVPRPPGALDRIFSFVQVIQESTACTSQLCTDLGIIGTQDAGPDYETLQADFKVKIVGGQVFIDWGWGGHGKYLDMIQIQVDRGQGWTDLAYDTTPGYTDTAPFPAALTTWRYRAIYRVGDAQVGVWSAEQTVNVGG